MTRAAALAQLFRERPFVWIDGADLGMISTFTTANPGCESMVFLASPATAAALAVASNSQTCGPNGGSICGVPIFTSAAVGSRLILMDPSALLLADDGQLDIAVSTQGTIELDTAATSPITAGAVLVNLWQAGLTAFRIDRAINWTMARANSVLWTTVSYS